MGNSNSTADIANRRYYHGSITTKEAEVLLKGKKIPNGNFLLRTNEKSPKVLILSVRVGTKKVGHYPIKGNHVVGERLFICAEAPVKSGKILPETIRDRLAKPHPFGFESVSTLCQAFQVGGTYCSFAFKVFGIELNQPIVDVAEKKESETAPPLAFGGFRTPSGRKATFSTSLLTGRQSSSDSVSPPKSSASSSPPQPSDFARQSSHNIFDEKRATSEVTRTISEPNKAIFEHKKAIFEPNQAMPEIKRSQPTSKSKHASKTKANKPETTPTPPANLVKKKKTPRVVWVHKVVTKDKLEGKLWAMNLLFPRGKKMMDEHEGQFVIRQHTGDTKSEFVLSVVFNGIVTEYEVFIDLVNNGVGSSINDSQYGVFKNIREIVERFSANKLPLESRTGRPWPIRLTLGVDATTLQLVDSQKQKPRKVKPTAKTMKQPRNTDTMVSTTSTTSTVSRASTTSIASTTSTRSTISTTSTTSQFRKPSAEALSSEMIEHMRQLARPRGSSSTSFTNHTNTNAPRSTTNTTNTNTTVNNDNTTSNNNTNTNNDKNLERHKPRDSILEKVVKESAAPRSGQPAYKFNSIDSDFGHWQGDDTISSMTSLGDQSWFENNNTNNNNNNNNENNNEDMYQESQQTESEYGIVSAFTQDSNTRVEKRDDDDDDDDGGQVMRARRGTVHVRMDEPMEGATLKRDVRLPRSPSVVKEEDEDEENEDDDDEDDDTFNTQSSSNYGVVTPLGYRDTDKGKGASVSVSAQRTQHHTQPEAGVNIVRARKGTMHMVLSEPLEGSATIKKTLNIGGSTRNRESNDYDDDDIFLKEPPPTTQHQQHHHQQQQQHQQQQRQTTSGENDYGVPSQFGRRRESVDEGDYGIPHVLDAQSNNNNNNNNNTLMDGTDGFRERSGTVHVTMAEPLESDETYATTTQSARNSTLSDDDPGSFMEDFSSSEDFGFGSDDFDNFSTSVPSSPMTHAHTFAEDSEEVNPNDHTTNNNNTTTNNNNNNNYNHNHNNSNHNNNNNNSNHSNNNNRNNNNNNNNTPDDDNDDEDDEDEHNNNNNNNNNNINKDNDDTNNDNYDDDNDNNNDNNNNPHTRSGVNISEKKDERVEVLNPDYAIVEPDEAPKDDVPDDGSNVERNRLSRFEVVNPDYAMLEPDSFVQVINVKKPPPQTMSVVMDDFDFDDMQGFEL